jgi:hypothetical protein
MRATMASLVEELTTLEISDQILEWACPVPYFGPIDHASVATVGINPSNREFVDKEGRQLRSEYRRLPTLESLEIESWSEVGDRHLDIIVGSCHQYFQSNPYRLWFDVLDRLLKSAGASYYSANEACHVDLVAFATRTKWGVLDGVVRRRLVNQGRRPMAELIRDSSIRTLVLNGRSVVREFEALARVELAASVVEEWTLPRANGRGVPGIAYSGRITSIANVQLGRQVSVLGFNHNLQSSYGVTTRVIQSIATRIGDEIAATCD